jgi:hypothetical protein
MRKDTKLEYQIKFLFWLPIQNLIEREWSISEVKRDGGRIQNPFYEICAQNEKFTKMTKNVKFVLERNSSL